MSRCESFSELFSGEDDKGIRVFLENNDDENAQKLRRVMLKVINNELTARQKEIIMLYYFKNMTMAAIGKKLGISVQAVSADIARARLRMFRILQYYI